MAKETPTDALYQRLVKRFGEKYAKKAYEKIRAVKGAAPDKVIR
jgi:hypothetical protein